MRKRYRERRMMRSSALAVTAAIALIASTFTIDAAQAATRGSHHSSGRQQARTPGKAPTSSAVPLKDRDPVLGKGWKGSADRAVTTAADSDGLHLLVADSHTGYGWRTTTVLSEPQLPADLWIGNQCLMDDHHAAVVYAPRTFTNKPDLMMGGAFTAIVNLDDGSVTKLPVTASLAYFDPSCNPATHTAVFTALRDSRTRLVTVDSKGATVADTTARGEITSAVPVEHGVIAAAGNQLVRVDGKGKVAELAATEHPPYGIRVKRDGSVGYLDRSDGDHVRVRTYAHGKKATVASGDLAAMSLRQGTDGTVYLTGKASHDEGLTASGIKALNVSPDAEVSTRGRLAVDPVLSQAVLAGVDHIKAAGRGFTRTATTEPAAEATPGHTSHALTISGTVPGTGRHIHYKIAEPGSTAGGRPSPALTGASKPQVSTITALTTAADPRANDPVDSDRWCSVPRNDVGTQALQPTPNQVEWAVDMAIQGNLRSGYLTQGGWRAQTGLSTIDPQGLFPRPTLTGGGRIPAQVQLGILAQESNLWQAESGAIPGQMGSPLAAVDGFYGHQTGGSLSEFWTIHWDKSDCGYGVGQVTDGMRKAGYEKPNETSLPTSTQRAVAIDYTTNIAASLYILAAKWNEVHKSDQTIAVNNDDPAKPENWFTAVWNYNLGFNTKADAGTNGNWGLGWYNNPANPVYPPSRLAFMNTDLDPLASKDAAHPQNWPYEEKVMGWAAWSIDTGHSYATSGRQDWPGESGFSSAGFRPASWNGTDGKVIETTSAKYRRAHVVPPLDAFCNAKNNCNTASPPDCPDANCYKQYWWHEAKTTWKSDCATSCGFESIKYQTVINEPGRGTRLQYGTPVCSGAPSGAKVVTSVPDGTNSWSSCGTTTSDGSFQFTFYPDPNATGPGLGQYDAKADLHQIGGGYNGHFWFTHARDADHLGGDGGRMTILGDWKLNSAISGSQAKVYVHIPDTGAQVSNATYKILTPFGAVTKTINQNSQNNKWVSLGAYNFKDHAPEVQLTNSTSDGAADKDVAYDAVAFVPGDYSGIPSDLTFSDPDVNAADPVPTETPNTIEGSFFAGSTSLSSKAKASSTASVITSKSSEGLASPSVSAGETAACSVTEKSMTYTRTKACIHDEMTVVHLTDGRPDGSAVFDYRNAIETDVNSDTFTQSTSIRLDSMSGVMAEVKLDLGYQCRGYCSVVSSTWTGSDTWTLGDTHSAIITTKIKWTQSSETKNSILPYWTFDGVANDMPIENTATVEKDDLNVRCDVEVKATPGCVFSWYKPTYEINERKFPAAAAHIWLVQHQLPGHNGLRGVGEPLTYLGGDVLVPGGNQAISDYNRNVICPEGWAQNEPVTLSPELSSNNNDQPSCDEFPFAASYESAAMPKTWGGKNSSPVTSGDQCVNTRAVKGSDGKWRMVMNPNYPVPTWTESCGRAAMSLNQNSQSMSLFPTFRRNNRVVDGDGYWLQADKPS
ncbi:golvesin C-terminal-like domain-containing protein [Streptomyces bauhiniae]|uniref:golvesin C-terminal-like domain-containing protein n=1 Tax=Streptomyces bauhiniae TaxID=2340725 RepID=UPI0036C046A4